MKRPAIYGTCIFFLITAFCLGTILAGWIFFKIPGDAEQAFGPPSAQLGMFERVYLSALLLMQAEQLKQPVDVPKEAVPFQVQLGESTYQITENLQSKGLVVSASALRDYLVYAGLDTSIQAGEYILNSGMTAVEIAHMLQDATPSEVTLSILPGWRLEEIAAALPTSGLEIAPHVFLANAAHPPSVSPLIDELPPGATLEGFLFPDSYRLPRKIAVDGLLRALLDNFEIKVENEIREGFRNQGLDLYHAVTLASIVEREAVVEDEMPLIASVFLNRLDAGMKLDTDPTVQYALGYNKAQGSWWTNPLSLKDLKIDSPYNTYLYSGLPPGPIANPRLSALRGVAFPAQTPYYYFRSACDGSGRHSFAQTFEEHQANACEQ